MKKNTPVSPAERVMQNTQAALDQKSGILVVAVSGGADSVFLLHCLQKLPNQKIVVAHVNHKTRGKKSDADALFVKNLAKKYGLPYKEKVLKKAKTAKSENFEELWREQRYRFFETVRVQVGGQWIVTAHHLADNLETVLLNFIRGSFLDGLSGMNMIDEKRHLLRPMLDVRKEDILKELKKNTLTWKTDATNNDNTYSRNRLRNTVIPLLKTFNPNLEETVMSNVMQIRELREALEKDTQEWSRSPLAQEPFLKLPKPLQKQVLAQLWKKTYGSTRKLTQKHLEQLLQVACQKKSNRSKEFGPKATLAVKKNADKRWIYVLEKKHKASTM